jgi:hypothetical protein
MMDTSLKNVNSDVLVSVQTGTLSPQMHYPQPGNDILSNPQYWLGTCGVILSIAVLLKVLLPVMLQRK